MYPPHAITWANPKLQLCKEDKIFLAAKSGKDVVLFYTFCHLFSHANYTKVTSSRFLHRSNSISHSSLVCLEMPAIQGFSDSEDTQTEAPQQSIWLLLIVSNKIYNWFRNDSSLHESHFMDLQSFTSTTLPLILQFKYRDMSVYCMYTICNLDWCESNPVNLYRCLHDYWSKTVYSKSSILLVILSSLDIKCVIEVKMNKNNQHSKRQHYG